MNYLIAIVGAAIIVASIFYGGMRYERRTWEHKETTEQLADKVQVIGSLLGSQGVMDDYVRKLETPQYVPVPVAVARLVRGVCPAQDVRAAAPEQGAVPQGHADADSGFSGDLVADAEIAHANRQRCDSMIDDLCARGFKDVCQ